MSTDRIEREISISAPIERVWAVLTESEQIGTWFGNGKPAEIDLRPGGIMVLDHADHGVYPTTIVKVDPPKAFSYRWASGYPGVVATEDNSTLVEFTLESKGDGTILRMAESGFDSVVIPPEQAADAGFDSHSKGWTGVIARLGELVEGKTLAPLV